jgi:DNA-binding MarR family transcriptional regulator
MTTQTPISAPQLGRAIALAHRPLVALREDVLRADGTSFEAWIVLSTLVESGGAADGDELRAELMKQLEADPWAVAQLVDRLEMTGDLRRSGRPEGGRVELTAAGESRHRRLREAFARTAATVLDEIDPADVETAQRVLEEVAERARSLRPA